MKQPVSATKATTTTAAARRRGAAGADNGAAEKAATAAAVVAPSTPPAARKARGKAAAAAPVVSVAPDVAVESAAKAAAATPVAEGKSRKKNKVVRDSFTMPEADYAKIAELKKVCLSAGIHVKKSEVLRAGLVALQALSTAKLKRVIAELENVKTGRPPA